MGVGAGIFLVAVGAILKYAVSADVEGVSLDVVGVILMIAGAAVAIISLFLYLAHRGGPHDDVVVDERRYHRVDSPL